MAPTQTPEIASTRLIIGLEIHIELATRTKMFTRAPSLAHPSHYDSAPNTLVDPLVMALPGALPVMNRRAVEMSMKVGLALGCTIARRCRWDRKNYYYPDLPKGYQISQYDRPLCTDGAWNLEGTGRRIGIIRAHLEEDTGKLGHELPGGHAYEGSLVDLNRAGTPLLEVVTAPDFTTADEVVQFAQELRDLCRYLRVTEGIMQKGHMRFEPNINLAITLADGSEVRTPVVEVKNLNSFRALKGAIEHEAVRQVEAWQRDGRVMGRGMKATRGWDDVRLVTVLQREKEDAHDYRYFPDPDLVWVEVDEPWLARVRGELVELPAARSQRYLGAWGLARKDADQILAEPDLSDFFEACVSAAGGASGAALAIAKLLLNVGMKHANERQRPLHRAGITPLQVAGLIALRDEGAINAGSADALFGMLCDSDDEPRAAAERAGMVIVRDDSALDAWVDAALAANAQAAADLHAGKMAAMGRIMGHVMKASGGTVDAKTVQARVMERVGKGA
ncbi:MAG: Asp-tRNA(Asn)/Glu-tRNA(Gln) amidotransferase subunit GatB [Planctomycetes bacterium]|nr:Asp-tRNA(Asn)/Glu-tRNA(Gln) amidotransferase subunit GatB [Planctomycetota bacterium]